MMLTNHLTRTIRRISGRLGRETRANVMLEFALSLPFLVAMVVGTFAVGLMFDRMLTEGQLARNAANMYARGIKFNTDQNKQLLSNAATGMNLQIDGTGDTVIYMTLLTKVPADANCLDASNNTVPCGNRGEIVIAQRYVVGNESIHDSQFGAIDPSYIDSDGNVIEYMHQSYARATVPPTVSHATNGLQDDELMYAVDVFHLPTLIKFPGVFAPELMRAWAYY